jgi:beta-galactosidase
VLFGGLYRDVFLVVAENLYVNFPWEATDAGVRVTTLSVSASSATVKVDTVVKNASSSAKTCTLDL